MSEGRLVAWGTLGTEIGTGRPVCPPLALERRKC